MKEISVGVILTPLTAKDWDLKEISTEIMGKGKFEVVHPPDNYYAWFSSLDGETEMGVYFDGMVYYIKKVRKGDVTPTQMVDIVKEGFDFIQNLPFNKNYFPRVGLTIEGKQMKSFYAERQQVITEFSKKLFKRPLFSEIEVTDSSIQISIRETPLLTFTST